MSTLVRRIDRLARDDSLAGWRAVKAQQAALARELLDEHVPATEIQEFLTAINGDLYRHIVEAALAAMAGDSRPSRSRCC